MKIYITKSNITCGPCSFINMTGIEGSEELEKELSNMGRIKPFYMCDYVSFLKWAEHFKLRISVWTKSKTISKTALREMKASGKIPQHKWKGFKQKIIDRYKKYNKLYSDRIHSLRDTAKTVKRLLDNGCKVAVLVSDFYSHGEKPVPHWIVAFKHENGRYHFMDSTSGFITLTRKDLTKAFALNKKRGLCEQLVAIC